MKAQKKVKKEYNTFEEFIGTFYPALDLTTIKEQQPNEIGRNVARSSLAKYGHLLHEKSSKPRSKVA